MATPTNRRRAVTAVALVIAVVAGALSGWLPGSTRSAKASTAEPSTSSPVEQQTGTPPSRFVGLTPARLLDTRPGAATVDGAHAGSAASPGGGTTELTVTGRGGVPADVDAVVLNITATEAAGPGYTTAWPCGGPRPLASNLNYVAGDTVPNLAVVKVGVAGKVCLYTATSAVHLVADVSGYFPSGSFTGLTPARLLDTRPAGATVDGAGAGGGISPAGGTVRLPVAGRAGVPADAAVVLNVTATEASGPGFVTAWPCSQPRPLASNLNYTAGSTRPNLVVIEVGPDDEACLHTATSSVHLIADVAGYVPAGTPFTGLTPARLLDSRPGAATVDGGHAGAGPLVGGAVTELTVTGRGGVPGDAETVVLNITATEADGPGYTTVWPCGQPQPPTSNLNYSVGDTVPNLALVKVGASGKVCLYTATSPVQLVADVAGYVPTAAQDDGIAPVGVAGSWRPVLAEEFDGPALDEDTWSTCYPHGPWYGCSSGELQWYLPDNVRLDSGQLDLVAESLPFQIDNDPPRFFDYRSGMISTLPLHHGEPDRFTFRYGYTEIRAKIPRGTGLFPAFWLVAAAGGHEEIDVFENLGHDTTTLYQTVHWPDPSTGGDDGDLHAFTGPGAPDYSEDFHVFGVDWQPDHISWYVDGQLARTSFTDADRIPDVDMGIIANLAVGGAWPCSQYTPAPCPASTSFPATYMIDYIRVWQTF